MVPVLTKMNAVQKEIDAIQSQQKEMSSDSLERFKKLRKLATRKKTWCKVLSKFNLN
jgi:hypothetical protein